MVFNLGQPVSQYHKNTHSVSLWAVLINFLHLLRPLTRLPSVLWRRWLGGKKGIQPVKTE